MLCPIQLGEKLCCLYSVRYSSWWRLYLNMCFHISHPSGRGSWWVTPWFLKLHTTPTHITFVNVSSYAISRTLRNAVWLFSKIRLGLISCLDKEHWWQAAHLFGTHLFSVLNSFPFMYFFPLTGKIFINLQEKTYFPYPFGSLVYYIYCK